MVSACWAQRMNEFMLDICSGEREGMKKENQKKVSENNIFRIGRREKWKTENRLKYTVVLPKTTNAFIRFCNNILNIFYILRIHRENSKSQKNVWMSIQNRPGTMLNFKLDFERISHENWKYIQISSKYMTFSAEPLCMQN